MAISKFFKIFKFSKSAGNLSKTASHIHSDIGIAAPYAAAFTLCAPFQANNDRV